MKTSLTKPAALPEHIGSIWDELVKQVRPSIGTAGLEALCIQVHRMREAQKRIADEGMIVQDGKSNPIPHPALAIEKQAQGEVRAWMARFGR